MGRRKGSRERMEASTH